MRHSNHELLHHIADEIQFCMKAMQNLSYDEFINDEKLTRAVIRSLEIIGEATKKIDSVFKSNFPLVDWKSMAGMRDRLVHDYFGVDYEVVYKTVQNNLPGLQEWINTILEKGY